MAFYPVGSPEKKLPLEKRAELCTKENMLLPDVLSLAEIVRLWEIDNSKHRVLTESLLNQIKIKALPVYTCGLYKKNRTCLYEKNEVASVDGIINRLNMRSAFEFSGVDAAFVDDIKIGLWPGLGVSTDDIKNILSNDLPPVKTDLANQILTCYTPEPPAFIEKLPNGFDRIAIHKMDFKKWLIDSEHWSIDGCLLEKWFVGEKLGSTGDRTKDAKRLDSARRWGRRSGYTGGKPDKWIVEQLRGENPDLWGDKGVSTFKKWLQSDFGSEGKKLFPNPRRK
jgi:hypothetical protein